jgi:hypothetical protein
MTETKSKTNGSDKPMTQAQQKFIQTLSKKYDPDIRNYITDKGLEELDAITESAENKSMTKEEASLAIDRLIHFDKYNLKKDIIKKEGRIRDHSQFPEFGWGLDYAFTKHRAKCKVCDEKIGPAAGSGKEAKNLRMFYWTPGMNDSLMTRYYHPECVLKYLQDKKCIEKNRINDKYDLLRAYSGILSGGDKIEIDEKDIKNMKKLFKEFFSKTDSEYSENHYFNKILGLWLKV